MREHPAQLLPHRRRAHLGHGSRSRGRIPGLAEGRGDPLRAEGLREDLGDASRRVRVESVGTLVGASGVNRHGADVALVGADFLRVPRGQVRGALEESAAPIQGHRRDAALRQGRGRVLREGLQARAARDLDLVGGADTQEQVALRIQVEGLVVSAQERAGRQRRRRIQVVERGESREGLRRRGGRVRGGGGRVQEDLTRLRVHDRPPRRVPALGSCCRDRRPQRLDVLGGNRVPGTLCVTGNRCGFKRRGRGGVRRSGRLRRTTGTH